MLADFLIVLSAGPQALLCYAGRGNDLFTLDLWQVDVDVEESEWRTSRGPIWEHKPTASMSRSR